MRAQDAALTSKNQEVETLRATLTQLFEVRRRLRWRRRPLCARSRIIGMRRRRRRVQEDKKLHAELEARTSELGQAEQARPPHPQPPAADSQQHVAAAAAVAALHGEASRA